ncbi:MAG: FAD-dependent oxidoreductase [Novosphingobium sp.]
MLWRGCAKSHYRRRRLVATAYTEYLALCDKMKLTDAIVSSSPTVGVVRSGRLIDIDTAKLHKAALTPALSFAAKLKLARGAWSIRKEVARTDAFSLVDRADDDDPADNAHDYAVRHFGQEAADYLINPLVRLLTGTHAHLVTTLMAPSVLSSWASPMINVAGGLDTLPHALAESLNISFSATCERIERTAQGVSARILIDGGVREIEADAAVVATQSDAAMRISPEIDGTLGPLIRRVEPLSLYTVTMAFDRPTKSKAYAVPLSTTERKDELGFFLQHNKAPDRAPPGKSLITFYIDHSEIPRYIDLSDDEIIQRGLALTTGLMPELQSSFLFGSVSRWNRAGSLATPGYYRNIRDMIAAIDVDSPIQLGGDVFGAGSMEAAIRGGQGAADRLLTRQSRHNSLP